MKVLFISHDAFSDHDTGVHHPENRQRLTAIREALDRSSLTDDVDRVDAQPATNDQLIAVHDEPYVDAIDAVAPTQGKEWLDNDTVMSPGSLRAAKLAAGAVAQGVTAVVDGAYKRVFCSVRPPGHHAEFDRACGFCLFNNVAVGAAHALNAHGIKRVAIVDFDVHHGNGTEDIFSGDDRVLYFSSFQHPLFPHSGFGVVADNIINAPLPGGVGGEAFRKIVTTSWIPRLRAFKPELILISAGFDAHTDDPIGGLKLTEDDFYFVTKELVNVANDFADGRVVSVLEGGYDLRALGDSAMEHLRALRD